MLRGVRVALTTVCCSSGVGRRVPKRARAASTIQGSRAIRAVSRYRSSFFAIQRGTGAEFTLLGRTMILLIINLQSSLPNSFNVGHRHPDRCAITLKPLVSDF